MPSRARVDVLPSGSFARTEFLDRRWDAALASIPLAYAALEGMGALRRAHERHFPRALREMDPACPVCGVETDEGEVLDLGGGRVRVVYRSCGHELELGAEEFEARMRGG